MTDNKKPIVGDAAIRLILVHAEGSKAFKAGQKIGDSPYMRTSAEHWVWRDGYIHEFRQSLKGQ